MLVARVDGGRLERDRARAARAARRRGGRPRRAPGPARTRPAATSGKRSRLARSSAIAASWRSVSVQLPADVLQLVFREVPARLAFGERGRARLPSAASMPPRGQRLRHRHAGRAARRRHRPVEDLGEEVVDGRGVAVGVLGVGVDVAAGEPHQPLRLGGFGEHRLAVRGTGMMASSGLCRNRVGAARRRRWRRRIGRDAAAASATGMNGCSSRARASTDVKPPSTISAASSTSRASGTAAPVPSDQP